MARKYTSRDTKSLINAHKENLQHLDDASNLPTKYSSRIQNCVNVMLSNGDFKRIVMDDLQGNGTYDKTRVSELIKHLYLFKRA